MSAKFLILYFLKLFFSFVYVIIKIRTELFINDTLFVDRLFRS